jgi:hypothetical protein
VAGVGVEGPASIVDRASAATNTVAQISMLR